jgi:hypothetical protein
VVCRREQRAAWYQDNEVEHRARARARYYATRAAG